jgi:hypothetical protein
MLDHLMPRETLMLRKVLLIMDVLIHKIMNGGVTSHITMIFLNNDIY